jgi:putative ABC transport system ATP-binding protein
MNDSNPIPISGLVLRGLGCTRLVPLDMDVARGECVGIMGASGAGKSLLLRQIADLDPGEGRVWFDGAGRAGMSGPAWRRQVVYCQAEAGWWDERIAPHFAGGASPLPLMDRLGLAPRLLDAQVHELSTGERQRMGLVRALLRESPVLLLDEPTAALDENGTNSVEAELRGRLAQGLVLVMVTHSSAQAHRLAHRIFHLQDGRLEAA